MLNDAYGTGATPRNQPVTAKVSLAKSPEIYVLLIFFNACIQYRKNCMCQDFEKEINSPPQPIVLSYLDAWRLLPHTAVLSSRILHAQLKNLL